MHIRLVFARTLFFVLVFSGYALQPAHAEYCTVADIIEGFQLGATLEEVEATCDVLDVNGCNATEVFQMAGEGYNLSDIYYECG